MRRSLAAITLIAGVIVFGIGARAERDAAGILGMHWTWWGSDPPSFVAGVVPRTVAMADFAAGFVRHRLVLHVLALGLAIALGLATARWISRWISVGAAARVSCCAAWWCALNPELAYFVATRDALGATHYLDLDDAFRALGAGMIVIAAAVWSGVVRTDGDTAGHAGETAPSAPRAGAALILAALAGALVPAFVARVALDREPLTNDEHAYLFQSRLFARGELVYDAHGLQDFFPARQVAEVDGAFFSKYPPAHSALLSIGERVGLPELVPRLLAALAVVLTWDLARRAGVKQPLWAAWFLALSPLWIGVESLWLSHTTSIPCSIVLVWSVLAALDLAERGRMTAARWLVVLGGFAFAVTLAARPVTALAVALPLVLLVAIERPRGALALVACGVAGALPGILALLWMNHALTGSAFQFAYELYAKVSSPEDRFGNVNVATALNNTGFNLSRLSIWLCGLSPGLLLAALGCLFSPDLRRRWVLCGVPAALLCSYALHPFQGIPWVGPLYLSEGLFALAIFGAQAIWILSTWLGRSFGRFVWFAIVASSALVLHNHFTKACAEVELRAEAFRPVRDAGITRGVVFVRYANAWAAKRFPLLPPEPESALVFALDLGRRNGELLEALGQTDAWVFDPVSGALRRWQ